jgi:hypothetical protein
MTIEIPIVTTYKDKGAKSAQNGLDKLAGTAKKLGLALGLALSVNKIVAFGKSAVKEFTDAEKASASLQNTLKNTGNLLAFPDTEAGIKNLAKLSGIADDSLIPLFSQLYLATGNVNQALKDLNLAIDVSRGSTNELGTVVDALSKGYMGNTKALGNLNVGLNKAYLASGNMVEIQKELNNTFGGASAAYLDTYAGKVAVLNNQWNETKEIVGQGLVMAFETATGNRGIGGMTDAMENFGYTLDAVIIKFGMFIDKAPNLADKLGLGFINRILEKSAEGWNYALGVDETRREIQNEIWRRNTKIAEDAAKNAEAQAKRNKEYLAFLEKQRKLAAAAAAAAKKEKADRKLLEQAGGLFDIDQIQIYAALQNKITDDEKLRLSLQMALIQENVTEAQRLATELFTSQLRTTNLADAIAKLPRALYPFQGWSSEIDLLLKQIELLKKLLATMNLPQGISGTGAYGNVDSAGRYIGTPFGQAGSNVSTFIGSQGGYDMGANYVGTPFGQAQPSTTTNIYVNGATQQLLNELRNGLIDSSASGSFATINSAAG